MSEILREQLSSFMDGELPAEECELLVKRVAASSELSETWHAYHVIGDALRDQLAPGAAQDLAPRVGRALDEERVRTRRPRMTMRRAGTLAAGVAVIGLAGVVGALVSHQIGSGQVFAPAGGANAQGAGHVQVDWRKAPNPVRSELNRYLLMHDPYGAAPQGLNSQNSSNTTTAGGALPTAGGGQGRYPR